MIKVFLNDIFNVVVLSDAILNDVALQVNSDSSSVPLK